jgi:quercetin dioxygenase-like cupin family protein
MLTRQTLFAFFLALPVGAGVALALAGNHDDQDAPKGSDAFKRTEVLSQELPKADFRKASMVTIDFAPGGEAPKHRHDVAVFGYVLEGSVENHFEGQKLKVYKQGEAWYESPGTVHVVARNASKTERAKLLVFYLGEEGKAPSTPIKGTPEPGR